MKTKSNTMATLEITENGIEIDVSNVNDAGSGTESVTLKFGPELRKTVAALIAKARGDG